MKKTPKYAAIVAFAAFTCVAPMLACKSAQLTPVQQEKHDTAVADGDFVAATGIQNRANEAQVKTFLEFVLDWVPAIPDAAKGALSTAGSIVGAGIFFERTRKHYAKVLKSVAQAVVEVNPLGSAMAPGAAVKEIATAFRAFGAGLGYVHTDAVEKEPV